MIINRSRSNVVNKRVIPEEYDSTFIIVDHKWISDDDADIRRLFSFMNAKKLVPICVKRSEMCRVLTHQEDSYMMPIMIIKKSDICEHSTPQ